MRQRKRKSKRPAGFADEGLPYADSSRDQSKQQVVELGAGGRLVIPAPMRVALGMKVGDRLTVRLDGSQVSVYTYQEGIRRAQELAARYLPGEAVDDFLRWKRDEALRERQKIDRWNQDE